MTDYRSLRAAKPAIPPPRPDPPAPAPAATAGDLDAEATTCPRCGESRDLAKVKGCVKCLKCGFKFDCNGW